MTAVIQMVDESETGAQNSKSILTRNDCSDIIPTLTVVKKTKAKTPRKYGVLRAFVF